MFGLRKTCFLIACALLAGPAQAGPANELPLTRGFYVSGDASCAEASGATVTLVGRKDFAWPQMVCTFAGVKQVGPTDFDVALDCEETADFPAETLNVRMVVPDDRKYGLSFSGEPPAISHFCAQGDLPEPWRSNDIAERIK